MRDFAYAKASTAADALQLLADPAGAKFLGGGTNLVDLMRVNIERPETVVDVAGLPLSEIEERPDGSLRIGAAAKNSAVAAHMAVRRRFPALAQAILLGASGQIRNMATVGGNIMQRTRCLYFYDEAAHCNKRHPGAGCDAIDGLNRTHAILGASPRCIAVHPSDMCVALAALGANVEVEGRQGKRNIPFTDFHRLPEDTPHIETNLQPGELITAIELPAFEPARSSLYRKVRDRASYAFALVSIAAVLAVDNGVVKTARIALGGVAHKPWRAFTAEAELVNNRATEDTFRRAAEVELQSAKGLEHNAFKIELAKRMIVDTLLELAQGGAQ